MTVSGNCSFSGTGCLVLKSPSDSGAPASFIPNGGITGLGTVQVERYLKKYLNPDDSRYHMLSAPMTSQEIQPGFVADPPESGTDFYRWGEAEGVWINSKDGSGNWNTSFQLGDNRNFIPGTGYLVAYPEDEMKLFTGSLIPSNLSPSITFTEGDYSGYNLIGNPFSSALNAEIGNWAKSNVDNAVWVWDGEAGNYKSWNGSAGNLTNGIIPAMQGFFVHANGPIPSLTIPASSRVHATQTFLKVAIQNTLNLTLFCDERNDGVTLSINDSSVEGYHPQEDVLKLYGASDAPQLFWIEEDTYLSVNVRPGTTSTLELPIGFIAGKIAEHRMLFSGQESFSNGEDLFLVDHLENKLINIRLESEYTFLSPEGYDASRFTIRIGNPSGEQEPEMYHEIFFKTALNRIIILGLDAYYNPVPVYLYDLAGNLVVFSSVSSANPVIETDLKQGVYILRLISPTKVISGKLYLKPATN